MPLVVLVLTAIAIATHYGRASIFATGPQGFTPICRRGGSSFEPAQRPRYG
jgi:K+-transporting ATPase A subunit